jgi:two-component system sensor histidine kinase DegS
MTRRSDASPEPPAPDPPAGSPAALASHLGDDVAALDRELAEIDMLIGQARAESARHEQKRAAAADKVGARSGDDQAEAYTQLVTLTRRAVLMEGQVDLLEGKRKALARHRDALAAVATALAGVGDQLAAGPDDGSALTEGALPPTVSRMVLTAQEDLRREIARQMHDGPAQSLTNIVLQAQIVARLLERDPDQAQGELRLLISMVQQTLDATKSFIFDVRPMVLDDLGLVPTLRRAARDRGRRDSIPVGFDSLGTDRRLPMDVESTVFRIVDEALTAYLGMRPDRVMLTLDWTDELEVRVSAERTPAMPDAEPLPEVPTGDVPDAIRQMIQDRHDARRAAIEAAEADAVVVLPTHTQRDIAARASSIGASIEILAGGAEVRLVVPVPVEEPEPAEPAPEPGPGATEPG